MSAFSCERAASSVLESRALSSACLVSCWSVVFGSRHSCFEFRSRDGVRTLALHFLSLCGARSRVLSAPRTLVHVCFCLCCTQFVFLSAACIYVVMSCVNTWLMSFLISCVFMSCFCTWLVICLLAMCLCFCFVWARASVLVFCVPRALINLSWPTHLVTWLLINFPQLLSLITLIICSLYNLPCVCSSMWVCYLMFDVICVLSSLVLPVQPCPALPCLLASQFCFPLRGGFRSFVCLFLVNKSLFSSAIGSSLSSIHPILDRTNPPWRGPAEEGLVPAITSLHTIQPPLRGHPPVQGPALPPSAGYWRKDVCPEVQRYSRGWGSTMRHWRTCSTVSSMSPSAGGGWGGWITFRFGSLWGSDSFPSDGGWSTSSGSRGGRPGARCRPGGCSRACSSPGAHRARSSGGQRSCSALSSVGWSCSAPSCDRWSSSAPSGSRRGCGIPLSEAEEEEEEKASSTLQGLEAVPGCLLARRPFLSCPSSSPCQPSLSCPSSSLCRRRPSASPCRRRPSASPCRRAQAPGPAGAAHAPRPAGAAHAPRPAGAAQAPRPAGAAHAPRPAGAAQAPRPVCAAHAPLPAAPPRLIVLPAPLKCLALPVPSRLLVRPGPPWQPAKQLAPPWPPDGLEPAWSVPPAPPWPSTRVPVRPDPPWSVPPAPPWLFARDPVRPDPPWSVPPVRPGSLPGSLDGVSLPGSTLPSLPGMLSFPAGTGLASSLPSLLPLFVSCLIVSVWSIIVCQSLCSQFLCCLFLSCSWCPSLGTPGGVPFGGGSVRVLSLRSSVIHGFVTEPWYSHHVRVFMWARGFECARVARSLSSACLVSCWSVVFGSRHSCFEFRSRDGVRTLALHFLSLCECASRVRSAPRTRPRVFCCVARSCFYRLRAFMLSCLVWTRAYEFSH